MICVNWPAGFDIVNLESHMQVGIGLGLGFNLNP